MKDIKEIFVKGLVCICMYVYLTWTGAEFANQDCFWLLTLTFSNGVVTGLAHHLSLLNPFTTGH